MRSPKTLRLYPKHWDYLRALDKNKSLTVNSHLSLIMSNKKKKKVQPWEDLSVKYPKIRHMTQNPVISLIK